MSTILQNTKLDLTAIYRLEFYRKQKDWKFCRDRQRKQAEKARVLNTTYTVEQPVTRAVLNEAFLDTGPESPPESPKDNWSIVADKPEPENLSEYWSDLEKSENWIIPNKVPEQSENTDKWIRTVLYWGRTDGKTDIIDDNDYTEPETNKQINDDLVPGWSEKWMNTEQEWPSNHQNWHNLWSDYCHCQKVAEGGGEDRIWPKETQYLNIEEYMEAWPDDELLFSLPDPPLLDPEHHPNYLDLSVQWAEFTQGASRAPHSSEADFTLPTSSIPDLELEELELSEAAGWTCTKRENTSPTFRLPLASAYDTSSCEEYPTRDVGLHNPNTRATPTRPVNALNTPTHRNIKVSNNIDIPKSGKPTSEQNYFAGTPCFSEKINDQKYTPISEYNFLTIGMGFKDIVLAGSFKNKDNFGPNYGDGCRRSVKYENLKPFEMSNKDFGFGPLVGRGRGRLNMQDTCKINNMRYCT